VLLVDLSSQAFVQCLHDRLNRVKQKIVASWMAVRLEASIRLGQIIESHPPSAAEEPTAGFGRKDGPPSRIVRDKREEKAWPPAPFSYWKLIWFGPVRPAGYE
jgi:hypothetical protein